jgi:hypothetical protein
MSVLYSRNRASCVGEGIAVELLVGARAVAPREIASHARELQARPQRRIGLKPLALPAASVSGVASTTVSARPPTLRTTGTVP